MKAHASSKHYNKTLKELQSAYDPSKDSCSSANQQMYQLVSVLNYAHYFHTKPYDSNPVI